MRVAEPHLQPGERAEIIAIAKVGSFPVKKNLAASTAAVAIGAALGGGVIMAFVPSEKYMLLTDRQLLVFAADKHTGGPGKWQASVPRQAISPTVVKDGLIFTVRLDIAGSDKEMILKFPPLPPSGKKAGRQLIASLESRRRALRY